MKFVPDLIEVQLEQLCLPVNVDSIRCQITLTYGIYDSIAKGRYGPDSWSVISLVGDFLNPHRLQNGSKLIVIVEILEAWDLDGNIINETLWSKYGIE